MRKVLCLNCMEVREESRDIPYDESQCPKCGKIGKIVVPKKSTDIKKGICPQDICPICGWTGLNYDRDYPDEVYAVCPQCNWRAFDHYKRDE